MFDLEERSFGLWVGVWTTVYVLGLFNLLPAWTYWLTWA